MAPCAPEAAFFCLCVSENFTSRRWKPLQREFLQVSGCFREASAWPLLLLGGCWADRWREPCVHICTLLLSLATHGCAWLKLKAAHGCAGLTTILEKSR